MNESIQMHIMFVSHPLLQYNMDKYTLILQKYIKDSFKFNLCVWLTGDTHVLPLTQSFPN